MQTAGTLLFLGCLRFQVFLVNLPFPELWLGFRFLAYNYNQIFYIKIKFKFNIDEQQI